MKNTAIRTDVNGSVGPGNCLAAIRQRLKLTTREVEEASRQMGNLHGSRSFCISHSAIVALEQSRITPSIYKLYTLSAIYHISFRTVASLYGINIDASGEFPADNRGGNPLSPPLSISNFPCALDTVLLGEPFRRSFFAHQIARSIPEDCLCGYIGSSDQTMAPIIRSSSLVAIDQHQNTVKADRWRNEFDRPIYFIELHEGYACAWCQLESGHLSLIPHPSSSRKVRRFRYPDEAEIVGRVIVVMTQLGQSELATRSW
jgi:transcriptional regulator with XRE-family HTH domain